MVNIPHLLLRRGVLHCCPWVTKVSASMRHWPRPHGVANCSVHGTVTASVTRAVMLPILLTPEVVILKGEITSPEGAHQQRENIICATGVPPEA